MVTPDSIKQSILAGLDCTHVEVAGDGHHWEAVIVSEAFRGKKLVEETFDRVVRPEDMISPKG